MGMDVIGDHPTTDEGEYFCNNNIWWSALADYINQVAPDIACGCKYWYSNDGDGLNTADALKLATVLQAEIDSGQCERYAARVPQEERPFNVENVKKFIAFLRFCGGFSIN